MMVILRKGFLIMILSFLVSCRPAIMEAVATSFAKEYCSCRFVEKQVDLYCKKYAAQMISVSRYKVEDVKVIVDALGMRSAAEFTGDKLGCVLTKNQVF